MGARTLFRLALSDKARVYQMGHNDSGTDVHSSHQRWDVSVNEMKSDANGDNNDLAFKKPIKLAIIGCGQRGQNYASYALIAPQRCKVVAIAEPRTQVRESMTNSHKGCLAFTTWQEFHVASCESIKSNGQRLADAVVVAVQDSLHKEVVLAFAEQGYHVLCEKPMATNIEDCIRIARAIKEANVIFGMGHVLRYSPFNKAIMEILTSGQLGRLINVHHIEPVGHYHFAHSYVRGNWNNEVKSSFSLMTKSCHDIDLICSWLAPVYPARVSSFGSLQHFKRSEKPTGAGDTKRCLECPIEESCSYSAKKIYLDRVARGHTGWPVGPIVDGVPDIENVTESLKNGPYGLCVFESENDVVDNQVVNLEFANGTTASFTMIAFTSLICDRQIRLHFTNGEIVGDMSGPTITVTDFRTSPPTKNTIYPPDEGGGHGGGDLGLVSTFVRAVNEGRQEILGTSVDEVLDSHLCVFAAEKSRKDGVIVDISKFKQEAWEQSSLK